MFPRPAALRPLFRAWPKPSRWSFPCRSTRTQRRIPGRRTTESARVPFSRMALQTQPPTTALRPWWREAGFARLCASLLSSAWAPARIRWSRRTRPTTPWSHRSQSSRSWESSLRPVNVIVYRFEYVPGRIGLHPSARSPQTMPPRWSEQQHEHRSPEVPKRKSVGVTHSGDSRSWSPCSDGRRQRRQITQSGDAGEEHVRTAAGGDHSREAGEGGVVLPLRAECGEGERAVGGVVDAEERVFAADVLVR